MKQALLLILLFLFLTVLTPPSFAQEKKMIQEAKQDKKAVLKKRLTTFKDTVKAERVNRINTILENVNTNRITTMETTLEKMTAIIARLENNLPDLEKKNKDTISAKQAIAQAKTAITTAKNAVSVQKDHDYTLSVTNENTVKAEAARMRNTLHSDLQNTHQLVVNARQVVAKAIAETKALLGEVEDGA